jgi:hypothetical protein
MSDLEEDDWYVINNEILDDLWPRPVPPWIYKHKNNTPTYVEHLDRYVDMGVLSRSGTGTRDDPYRFEVLLSTLGAQVDEDGHRVRVGYRRLRVDAWRNGNGLNSIPPLPISPDDVPRDLLDRLLARDAG